MQFLTLFFFKIKDAASTTKLAGSTWNPPLGPWETTYYNENRREVGTSATKLAGSTWNPPLGPWSTTCSFSAAPVKSDTKEADEIKSSSPPRKIITYRSVYSQKHSRTTKPRTSHNRFFSDAHSSKLSSKKSKLRSPNTSLLTASRSSTYSSQPSDDKSEKSTSDCCHNLCVIL